VTLAAPERTLLMERYPETDDELWWLVFYLWGVKIPRHAVCPGHVAPFTAFADAFFRRNSIDPASQMRSMALWWGSRGLSGKSFMLAILGLTIAFLRGSDVNLLGGSFEQSANIHIHMRAAMESANAPRYMIAKEAATEIKLTNKATIHPLTASQKTVRGPHPPTLLLDEIDEMELAILDASLGQPLPQTNWKGDRVRPYTVMCSTWQNPDGTFTAVKRRAEETGIPIYAWCLYETSNPVDGWLGLDTIAEKKAAIPKAMWEVEYLLGEPSIGNRAFDTECVDRTFSLPFAPLESKVEKDYEEYTFERPAKHGTYVLGADWGKESDDTVIGVYRIDTAPKTLAYFLRVKRRPYPVMIGAFNAAMTRYHVPDSGAWHDGTGLGNVVNDYLDTRARAFLMTGEKRDVMLSEWVSAVEKAHEYRFPRIPSMWGDHRYARHGDLYSRAASQYHLPDAVCMAGLAHHAATRIAPVVIPLVVPRDEAPSRLAQNFLPDRERVDRDGRRVTATEPISLVV
jgi:hypothetical protein